MILFVLRGKMLPQAKTETQPMSETNVGSIAIIEEQKFYPLSAECVFLKDHQNISGNPHMP